VKEAQVGSDGHNRTIVSAFRSKTGRNQPSNTRFIFGPSTWLRYLIRPGPQRGLAYIDWQQQEFGIAAALSGDTLMKQAYQSGDPYLAFAKQAKAVPPEATKASHKSERDRFKACVLAVQYGMGEASLAHRIGQPPIVGRELLKLHRATYQTFWRWSDAMLDDAMLSGKLQTVFGWRLSVGANPNPRSLRNFHMQANGAEMLRLACCKAVEEGRHRKPVRHCRCSRAGAGIARLTTTEPPPARPAMSWRDTYSIRDVTSVAYRTARTACRAIPAASTNRAAPLKSPYSPLHP
jgi:DNA polymerase-1